MKKTDLDDLKATVERLRKEIDPDLDSAFLADVIEAEADNPEDDAAAVDAIRGALERSLGEENE